MSCLFGHKWEYKQRKLNFTRSFMLIPYDESRNTRLCKICNKMEYQTYMSQWSELKLSNLTKSELRNLTIDKLI